MKKYLICMLIAIISTLNTIAQDDLMAELNRLNEVKNEPVIATFKSLKIINAQTNETVHKHVLDFRIAHRFGNISTASNGGFHTLYGLDFTSDVRIAFEYGITDRLEVGISRSKYEENLEGLIKYRLLKQTTNNKIPISITLFSDMSYSPIIDEAQNFVRVENGVSKTVNARRLKYATEIIFARKFSSSISILISPTYVHRNYINDPNEPNDLFAVGIGARIKISKGISIIGDYFFSFNNYRKIDANPLYYDPLGLGIEFETGGHVFSLMFTNSPAIIETTFLDTHDNWIKGGVKFGFNISRNFSFQKSKPVYK